MTHLFRVAIPVSNIQRSVAFYQALLCNDGERLTPGWHYFNLGGVVLALHDAVADGDGDHAALTREPVCIAVDEPLVQLHARARSLLAREVDETLGLLPTGEAGFSLADPDGNLLQMVDSRTMVWGRHRQLRAVASAPAHKVMLFSRDFLNAVKGGELARVKELLALDPDMANACDDNGVSALMVAAYKQHARIVAHLARLREDFSPFELVALGDHDRLRAALAQDASIARAVTVDGFTLLGLACYFGQPECVWLLLEHDADPNTVSRNAQKAQPLHSALRRAPVEQAAPILTMLLARGADPNAADGAGYTPMRMALSREDNTTLVRALLKAGARIPQSATRTPVAVMAVKNQTPSLPPMPPSVLAPRPELRVV